MKNGRGLHHYVNPEDDTLLLALLKNVEQMSHPVKKHAIGKVKFGTGAILYLGIIMHFSYGN